MEVGKTCDFFEARLLGLKKRGIYLHLSMNAFLISCRRLHSAANLISGAWILSQFTDIKSIALQDVCEYNNISEEQLVDSESITSLEMFLFNLPRICCMSFFPNLVSLTLVQQNLKVIEGLHGLPHLEILHLSDNNIKRIEGLSSCLKLTEIFLHSNQITRITNLSHLASLKVLWLANNHIRWVEGLDNLQIKELNLARNPLSRLGDLLKLKTLRFLNVAGTNIGSFQEISNLTRLKNLEDLRFFDPNWGTSPLALLNNYRTYILFRLQNLQVLDQQYLNHEVKQEAKAIYRRKRVYYNMCIKSLQQSRNYGITFVAESGRVKSLQKYLAHLTKTLRDMEKEMADVADMEESAAGSNRQVEAEASQEGWWLRSKIRVSTLTNQISYLTQRLDFLTEDLKMLRAKEQAAADLNIHWLMVELDSGMLPAHTAVVFIF